MAEVDADLDLLFGVLALQDEMIDAAQFAEVCEGWAKRMDVPLAILLIELGWITHADRAEVERRLRRKLRKHGDDAHATLGAVAGAAAREVIRSIAAPEIRETLMDLPPAADYVSWETVVPPAGSESEVRLRYALMQVHAEGGLGRVWMARDSDLNREVALKEIHPEKAGHADARRRFLKEAQITGQLEHPNIVPVYELARNPLDGQPFYTMRLVRGRTFRDIIAEYHQRRGQGETDPIGRLKLIQAFVSICQAISYAHSRRVIHRDLKPENVMLGGFGEVIVLDWGLARMMEPSGDSAGPVRVSLTEEVEAARTLDGGRIGTPSYMAPEQAEGRLDLIDARTDIYGLGTILFEILTGRPPHEVGGRSIPELLDHVALGETPRARSVEPSAPRALERICARAMAKRRDDRYEGADDIVHEVQRWLASPEDPRVEVGTLTHPGKVRESNEDHFHVAKLSRTMQTLRSSLTVERDLRFAEGEGYLLVVADGMGGAAAGGQASKLAVETVNEFVLNVIKWFHHLGAHNEQQLFHEFRAAFDAADRAVFNHARADPRFSGMGTTLTVAISVDDDLYVVHAGDNRVYLFRDGELTQLTNDHTLAQLLVHAGALTPEDAKHHNRRNVITNVIGGTVAGVEAEIHRLRVYDGDVLLLCTDGLTEVVDDDRIAEGLKLHRDDPDAACRHLIDLALAAGGPDNVTAVVARFFIKSLEIASRSE